MNLELFKQINIEPFLQEDIGTGDVTAAIIPENRRAVAQILTREAMVLCGQVWFDKVFFALDKNVSIRWQAKDGDYVDADFTLCTIEGNARALLTGERTALNLLQTLSATATTARQYAKAVEGTNCKILDTRKTIPSLRLAQKYAVTCGGCYNHRIGLFDYILIKENHILASGSIEKAVNFARQQSDLPIEVEVENLHELKQALAVNPNRIMLDNFSLTDLKTAVEQVSGCVELEASGNIDLTNIHEIAQTGVDFISIGALTKHIQAIDLSMRIQLVEEK